MTTNESNGPIYLPLEQAGEDLHVRIARLESLLAQSPTAPDGYAPSLAPLVPVSLPGETRRRWFEWPLLRELKFIAQMYLDPRYRLSRLAQFGVPGVFVACLLNYLVFNYLLINIPVLTQLAERGLLLFLGMVLYMILRHETTRYQAVLDYLARVGK